ncbi:uncharacterized protein LOC105171307 [Sesamum indicum]|uniref:Uncharacterized protein LOC105171307 n=1 Tax=Sesamum indicum TaxID=4182 RepID=A0A6I9U9P7_SESIN|nr:uncharacterized protein LOC105171307 [Sesamum indicum]
MAVPFLALLLLLGSYCSVAAANFDLPFFSPSFGNPCRENVCGKGSCVTTNNSSFGFECECQHGWIQARSQDDDHLKFLPCVIPNCTLNHACTNAPAPAADNHKKPNLSFFDPCFWTDCGGGSCNTTSPFTHTCLCEEGYYNLFNSTAFPCYKECAIGFDCPNLGLDMMPSPPPSPSLPDDSKSHAASLIPRAEFGWLIIMATTSALAVWKHI